MEKPQNLSAQMTEIHSCTVKDNIFNLKNVAFVLVLIFILFTAAETGLLCGKNTTSQHTQESYSHSSGSGRDGSSLFRRPGLTQPRLYLCSPTAMQLWHSSHGGWHCTEDKKTANSLEGI